VRVLLGGKATVTARERSVLTITEVPGVATINLGAGRIAVAVAKGLMKPGEVIQIKTPNAVTAIRGTVVIAEVEPVSQGSQSTITILRGLVDVTRLDPAGALTGPAVKVGALERVTVVNAQPVPAPQKITRDAASRLAADFSFVPTNAPAASIDALGAEAKDITIRDAMQIVGAVSPAPPAGTSGQNGGLDTTGQGGPSTAGQGVTGGVSAAVGGVTNTATGAVGAVTGGVTGTLNGVTGAATGAVTGLTSPVTQAVAPVVNPVTSPVTNLATTVTNTVNNVTSPVTNPILPGLLRRP
jgi:FecR protein